MNLSNYKTLKDYLKARLSNLRKSKESCQNDIRIIAATELLAHLNSIKQ